MSDPEDSSGSPPLRSGPLAAVVVALVAAMLVGGGFIVTQLLRGSTGTELPSAPAVGVTPGPTQAVVQPTARTTPVLTPVPTSGPATPAPRPVTAPTTTVLATPQVTMVPGGGPRATMPTPEEAVGVIVSVPIVAVDGTEQAIWPGTPTPTVPWWQRTDAGVTDSAAQGLLTGYLRFWDIRARALLTLDSASLGQVLDGPPLKAEVAAIEQLRAAGQVQRVEVQHEIEVLWVTSEEGAVRDTLRNRSTVVGVDPTRTPEDPAEATQTDSNAPVPAPESTYRMAYRLERLQGAWKVIEAVHMPTKYFLL